MNFLMLMLPTDRRGYKTWTNGVQCTAIYYEEYGLMLLSSTYVDWRNVTATANKIRTTVR